jgi:hypothetical protein
MYCAPFTWQKQQSLGREADLAELTGALCFSVCPG